MTLTLSPSRDILLRDSHHEDTAELVRILFRTKKELFPYPSHPRDCSFHIYMGGAIEIDPRRIFWRLQHQTEVAL